MQFQQTEFLPRYAALKYMVYLSLKISRYHFDFENLILSLKNYASEKNTE